MTKTQSYYENLYPVGAFVARETGTMWEGYLMVYRVVKVDRYHAVLESVMTGQNVAVALAHLTLYRPVAFVWPKTSLSLGGEAL